MSNLRTKLPYHGWAASMLEYSARTPLPCHLIIVRHTRTCYRHRRSYALNIAVYFFVSRFLCHYYTFLVRAPLESRLDATRGALEYVKSTPIVYWLCSGWVNAHRRRREFADNIFGPAWRKCQIIKHSCKARQCGMCAEHISLSAQTILNLMC